MSSALLLLSQKPCKVGTLPRPGWPCPRKPIGGLPALPKEPLEWLMESKGVCGNLGSARFEIAQVTCSGF